MNIAIPTVFTDGPTQTIYADEVNANFDEIQNKFNTYAVQTDVVKTITVRHEFAAGLLISTNATWLQGKTMSAVTRDLIGVSAADKVRIDNNGIGADFGGSATFGGNLHVGADNFLGHDGRSVFTSPSDGVMRVSNNIGTDFDRFQFGGTTSSFPALKRSTVDLQVKLADDSAYTNLDALAYKVSATKVVGARKTGWAVATGTPTRTTFVTSTVTLPQLAERVKALIDDLHGTAGHGLIGT